MPTELYTRFSIYAVAPSLAKRRKFQFIFTFFFSTQFLRFNERTTASVSMVRGHDGLLFRFALLSVLSHAFHGWPLSKSSAFGNAKGTTKSKAFPLTDSSRHTKLVGETVIFAFLSAYDDDSHTKKNAIRNSFGVPVKVLELRQTRWKQSSLYGTSLFLSKTKLTLPNCKQIIRRRMQSMCQLVNSSTRQIGDSSAAADVRDATVLHGSVSVTLFIQLRKCLSIA